MVATVCPSGSIEGLGYPIRLRMHGKERLQSYARLLGMMWMEMRIG